MAVKRGGYIYEDGYSAAWDHREDEDERRRDEHETDGRDHATNTISTDKRGGPFFKTWPWLTAAILVIAFGLLWTQVR